MYMAEFVTYAIATPVSGFVIDCGFPLKWMLLVGHVMVLIGGMALGCDYLFLNILHILLYTSKHNYICTVLNPKQAGGGVCCPPPLL